MVAEREAKDGASQDLFEGPGELAPANQLDAPVFSRLKRLNIQPAAVCSDSVFLRRVYLDAIGTLPTPEEAADFLADRRPIRRRALVQQLLERPEFADYWAMKWGDLLRVKAEFPINLWPNAVQAYHRWIHTRIRENTPYDRFARDLLTGSGSNFREGQVNFFRAVQSRDAPSIARAVALTFMGARADKWPKDRLNGMAAFFTQIGFKSTGEWKEEIVFFDPNLPRDAASAPMFPDGTPAQLDAGRDPRGLFADWLTAPRNPWFARNLVNRLWSWLLGRGIVHEPDDIRPDNPPSNAELLALLEREFAAARYDMKHMFRMILTSRTYQLSSIPRSDKPEAAAQFASYPLRRLDAEVLIDALCQITGTTEQYSSATPEPFTFIPEDQRSIALADGSISSSFLEMFGRPARDTGMESERNNRPTADQRLHLLNSSHIRRKLEHMLPLVAEGRGRGRPREIVDQVYLRILSRYPTHEELMVAGEHVRPGRGKAREGLLDLAWSLVNSAEFLYRH